MRDFLAMGGYALYVWSSFAVAAALIGAVALWSSLEARRVERETFARALRPRAGRTGGGDVAPGDASAADAARAADVGAAGAGASGAVR